MWGDAYLTTIFLSISFALLYCYCYFLRVKAVRRFLHPPAGATWMDVEVKDCREAGDNAQDGTRLIALITLIGSFVGWLIGRLVE